MKKILTSVFLLSVLFNIGQDIKSFEDYIINKFIDSGGKEIVEIVVPGKPPYNFKMPVAQPTDASIILSNVPGYDWSFGCSATSAAMLAGYYDRTGYPEMYSGPTNGSFAPLDNSIWGSVVINGETRSLCPLSATGLDLDGRSTRGHIDDYWIQYGNSSPDPFITNGWSEHPYEACTGDFMKTNQSNYGNSDASTTFWYYTDGSPYDGIGNSNDGMYGIKLFFESRGYSVISHYNQFIYGYNGNTLGFTFNQFKQEINAGRPVIIQVAGHSMIGFGYDDTGNTIYLHDTWDYSDHTMTWGEAYAGLAHYGVGVISLEQVAHLTLTPDSYDFGCSNGGYTLFNLINDGGSVCNGFISLTGDTQQFYCWIDGGQIYDPYPFELLPGENIELEVSFTPWEPYDYYAQLSITCDQCSHITAELSGEGWMMMAVNTSSDPIEGGTTYPGSEFYSTCDTACITAYPNPGYEFDHWLGYYWWDPIISYEQQYCYTVFPYSWNNWTAYFKPKVEMQLKVFLEGSFNGIGMNNNLVNTSTFPLHQPFNVPPWNYNGNDSIISISNPNIVDWVLIELRETTGSASTATNDKTIAKKSAFVLSDGSIVDMDGVSNLRFVLEITNNLYVIVWHRNHLGIMSANAVVRTDGIYSYDFTSSYLQVYGGTFNTKELSAGVWGMIAGDGNADGEVSITDKTTTWNPQSGKEGYLSGDYGLDNQVNNKDKNNSMLENLNKSSQVPGGVGFSCGEQLIDSRDGQSYNTVQIGDQCWMEENMNYPMAFSKCYNDDEANCDTYGRLYIASGIQSVCPDGWHVPAVDEWSALITHLGGATVAGGKMKTTGTLQAGTGLWNDPNTGATNESGFSALPAGYYIHWSYPMNFYDINNTTDFWTSTEHEIDGLYAYKLMYNNTQIYSFHSSDGEPYDSWSVRCMKDEPISWSCGDQLIDSRDNQNYNTVQIGSQCWMAENLNYGTMIDTLNDQSNNGIVEKYCYQNDEETCMVYGAIYQWSEIMNYTSASGAQGICPDGWHIPTDPEWCVLENFADSDTVDCGGINYRGTDCGGNLKDTVALWIPPNTGATNTYGFSSIPGGYYSHILHKIIGVGLYGQFFTSTVISPDNPWTRSMDYNVSTIRRKSQSGEFGLNLRCIKN